MVFVHQYTAVKPRAQQILKIDPKTEHSNCKILNTLNKIFNKFIIIILLTLLIAASLIFLDSRILIYYINNHLEVFLLSRKKINCAFCIIKFIDWNYLELL